jgi:hypothetical protein
LHQINGCLLDCSLGLLQPLDIWPHLLSMFVDVVYMLDCCMPLSHYLNPSPSDLLSDFLQVHQESIEVMILRLKLEMIHIYTISEKIAQVNTAMMRKQKNSS